MEKINIAELLKDCPKGMELDCTMYENIYFNYIEKDDANYPIRCYYITKNNEREGISFTSDGRVFQKEYCKCVIFPKGKTTWKGFVPPCTFEAGDVLVSERGNIVLLSHIDSENIVHYHCIIPTCGSFRIEENTSIGVGKYYDCVLANEQQRKRMYDKIKCSWYKYNQSTNKLEKLTEPKFKVGDVIINIYRKHLNCDSKGGKISQIIDDKYIFDNGSYTLIQFQDNYELVSNKLVEPKFKVGDRIVRKNSACTAILITNVGDEFYYSNTESSVGVLPISDQDDYELVPNKFDITTLVPFESRVLVREEKQSVWRPAFYGFFHQDTKRFYTTGLGIWLMCIPHNEDTKHLTGTTDDCAEFYKTWKE